jgi:hypothetical protein
MHPSSQQKRVVPRFVGKPGQHLRRRVIVQTQDPLDPSRGTRPLAIATGCEGPGQTPNERPGRLRRR